ncbi:MAG: winged helix DNA-binding domain-containing protein [Candidatus Dormibacteria bacterium]
MTGIAARRLQCQRLSGEPFPTAAAAVGSLVAVQSQDYAGARWAVGQRTRDVTDSDVDRLCDDGTILRTHVMRPTWHLVLADDVRWLLDLTAPRVRATLAYYDRRAEVDGALLRRSLPVIEAALGGGHALTRGELGAALARAGIAAAGSRLGHLVMHAELDAIAVSGPRHGKAVTYALLEERAPAARRLDRDASLAELARRYFAGHGPAQVRDFVWWSGLTLAEAKRGIAMAGPAITQEQIGDRWYLSSPEARRTAARGPVVNLLPNFDEFLVAYRDRSAALEHASAGSTLPLSAGEVLGNVVLLDGQVWGYWKRRRSGPDVVLEVGPIDRLGTAASTALQRAAGRLGRFLGAPVTIVDRPSHPCHNDERMFATVPRPT